MNAIFMVLATSSIKSGALTSLRLKQLDLKSYPDIAMIKVSYELSKSRIGCARGWNLVRELNDGRLLMENIGNFVLFQNLIFFNILLCTFFRACEKIINNICIFRFLILLFILYEIL